MMGVTLSLLPLSLSPPLLNHILAEVDDEEEQEQEQGDCTITLLPPVRVAGYPGSVRIPARARIAEDLQAEEELRAGGVDPVRGPDIPLLSEEEAMAGNKAAVLAGEPAASRRRMRVAHGASDLFSNAQVIFGYPRGRAEDAALAWVCHHEEFELRPVRPNMVLLCLVRELLINALDAGSRTGDMTRLRVRCTSKKFSVWNDGADVAVQRMADVLDPCAERGGAEDPHLFSVEYLFTCPSSSQNEHHRQRGDRSAGHNGLGTKAVCAFSDRVEVNVCDGQHEYFQQFLYNLRRKTEPELKEVVEGTAPHFGVKVEWDLAMVYADDPDGVPEQADEDTLGVVRKLVHDAALMLGPRVEVTLDGRVLPATAEQYLRLYKDAQLMGIDYVECTSGAAEEEEEEGEVVCRAAALWWEEVRTEDEPLSAHTCFVNTVPTSGVLGPTVVRTLANGVADKDPKLQDLRVLQRTPAQRKRFAGLVERRLSCLLLCSVDGDVPWEHQTKIRCTPFPKGSAAWRLLQEAAQQLLQGGHRGLRTQVCNRVRAMHIRALEEAKLQRQLLDERRAGRAHPSDEFPVALVGKHSACETYDQPYREDALARTLFLVEGKSAGGLVADGLSSLPAEVRQNCGLLCLEGKPENSASFVRKLVKEVQRELRDERGDEAEAALSDEGRMHQKLVDRLQQRLGDKHQDKKRGDMVQLVLTVVAGARHGQDYTTPAACRALRYDRVVAMVDADQHGTHILSLIITTLDSLFPSLLRRCKEPSVSPFTAVRRGNAHRHPFMYRFLTPLYLLVLRQGEEGLPSPLSFCTEEEYGEWRAHTDERVQARYQVRYFKGLGSITGANALFRNLDAMVSPLLWSDHSPDALEAMMGRDAAQRRQLIMGTHELLRIVHHESLFLRRQHGDALFTTVAQFMCEQQCYSDRQVVLSHLPHMVDGLKRASRSVVVSLCRQLEKGGVQEMKIPELAGLVMRREGYAHGDSTLQDDIIFMGSQLEHSAPLLRGLGVFACKASRKAASARYLSARASPLLRLLFPPRDVPALERDPVSGHVSCFPGTLCTTLLDSVAGLSRGFKCSLPKYHPRDILYLQWLTLQEVLREEGVGGQEEVGWELGDVCEELRGYAPRGAQPWYRDCQEGYHFVSTPETTPAWWYEGRSKGVSIRKGLDPEDPMGRLPSRAQDFVSHFLLAIPLRGFRGVPCMGPRDGLIDLEEGEEGMLRCDWKDVERCDSWTLGVLCPWRYSDTVLEERDVLEERQRERPLSLLDKLRDPPDLAADTEPWPRQATVTVEGLPHGVTMQDFAEAVDRSPFCRALLAGRSAHSTLDRQQDRWTCTLTLQVANLQRRELVHRRIPGLPAYSPLAYGSPTAYLILMCWRHIPYLHHLYPSMRYTMVGPGLGDVSVDVTLREGLREYCRRRLHLYRSRLEAERERAGQRVREAEQRVRFHEVVRGIATEGDPLRLFDSEYVRERLRQADAFVPPGTALDFADGKRQADEEELRAAREHQAHVEASTPCALWLEDLRELYPVLQQELARPVWYKEDEE